MSVLPEGRTKRPLLLAAITLALALFALAVYRAATSGLTYDEAYTALRFAMKLRPSDIPRMMVNCIANNHWINTVLIRVVQFTTRQFYNEFLIRLPSLLFYAAFLGLAVYMLYRGELSCGGFALLTLCYYLNDFFGLARGYGMAVCLLLFALRFYQRWRGETGRYALLTWSLFFFAAAAFAQTLSLMVMGAVGLVILLCLLREKRLTDYVRKQWLPLLPIAMGALLMVVYHLNISRPGKPLPISPPTLFAAFAEGFASLYTANAALTAVCAWGICAFLVLSAVAFRKRLLCSKFFLAALLYLLLWAAVNGLLHVLPDKRSLLVSLPLLALALCEAAGWIGEALGLRHAAPCVGWVAGAALAAVLAVAFLSGTDLHTTEAWRDNYATRDVAYEALRTRTAGNQTLHTLEPYPLAFYREKIIQEHGYNLYENWWH